MIQRSTPPVPPRPRAFTLIELLIVIGILVLLMAISVVVGAKIVGSGKQRATEGILKALDTSLSEYIHTQERNPPPIVTDPRDNQHVLPVADAMIPPLTGGNDRLLNSVGLFLLQTKAVPEANSSVSGIDAKYLKTFDPDSQGMSAANSPIDTQPSLLTVFDGWGQPIRYVHPAFQGAFPDYSGANLLSYTAPDGSRWLDKRAGAPPPGKSFNFTQGIRRNASSTNAAIFPDADGGLVPNNRPYFYSVGPDGHTGYSVDANNAPVDFNKDNLYLATPRYQK